MMHRRCRERTDLAQTTHLASPGADTPGGLLRQRVAADPDKVALHYPGHGTRLTFAQWLQQAEAFAKSLLDLGLEKGDRLALLAENRVEWSVVQMAAALGGFILVPVNTHSRSDDLLHALHQSQSRALVLTESFRSNAFLQLVDSIRDQLPDLEHTVVIAPSAGSPWPP